MRRNVSSADSARPCVCPWLTCPDAAALFGISHGHALGIAGSDERGHAAILPPSMALFTSDTKDALKKLSAKAYESTEERDALLAKVAAAEGLKASDVVWMLF